VSVEPVEELAGVAVAQVGDATGHVVIVEGPDDTGAAAVGVWHVSATGTPTGAWITPVSTLADGAAAAGLLRRLTASRALFGWEAATARAALDRFAGPAGHPLPAVLLPEVLQEIAQHRHAYAEEVEAQRSRSRSKVEPLAWQQDIPAVGSWQELVTAARLRQPVAASPVAAQALHLARAAAWAAGLWHDTETVRSRRRYLVERFGPATVLPPAWLARLREAHAAAGPAGGAAVSG
jgi:hypothetical protein